MYKHLLQTVLLLLVSASVFCQTPMNKDSLLKLLPQAKEDSNAVFLYINIGQQYENDDYELAKVYYRKAGDLSKKINFPQGIIKYINNYTFLLNQQGFLDSSLQLNLQGVAISRSTKDSLSLAKTLFNTGTSYRYMGQYEQAVQHYEEGKKLFARFGNEETAALCNDILQLLYHDLGQYDKAITYGENAVRQFRQLNNPDQLGSALNNLGLSYTSKRDFSRALQLFNEALSIGKKTGSLNLEGSQLLNIANIYLQQEQYELLEPYFSKAAAIYRKLDSRESLSIALRGLCIAYFFKQQYQKSAAYGEQALEITTGLNLREQRRKNLESLSSVYYALHELEKGEQYLKLSTAIGDSTIGEQVQQNTLSLEKKYESEKKENQIKQLTAEKKIHELSIRQKNTLNYFLIAGAVILVLLFILFYYTYRQKQKLQQQRISELETQQQLLATEAVLKGEEQERTRLAKDLHDGLGGMLSGIKYSLNTVKGNLLMTPDNQQAFERSMDMLDSSIKEMRRVAHNMMPEALIRFGLDTALKDFCNDINRSGALDMTYQSIGLESTAFDQTTAVTIYRIVQELINNTMKHAAAKKAIVQVTRVNDQLSVTVEDDGKGFDPSLLNAARGIGWANINNRVEFLKGRLDIQSAPGKGTSVLLEFAIHAQ
jgi:two-component system NarL family sensor kinase